MEIADEQIANNMLAQRAVGQTGPYERVGPMRYAPAALGMGLALAALVLYMLTLAPSVMPGDYAEFQFSAAILGVPHPTGYSLYILLGKLFTFLPFGDVAYRVNLSSAVYMSAAVGVGYAVALKMLRLAGWSKAWWVAGVGLALFAIAPTPWSMALVARSYALNALLVASVLYALITWRTTLRARWFYLSVFLIGLSLVHHATTYLLLPAYGLYLLLAESEYRRAGEGEGARSPRAARRLFLGVLCFLAGLSPLLFLVYRFVWGSPYYWGSPTTWKDFFNLLSGGPFRDQVFGFGTGLATQWDRMLFGLGELSGQYTLLGIAVGLVGLAALLRYRRAEAGLLLLMMAGNFLFSMNYSLVGYLYFIPTYLIWALFMSSGTAWIVVGLARALAGRRQTTDDRRQELYLGALVGLAGVAFVVALVYAAALRYPNIDQSGQTAKRDQALQLLNDAPQGATLYLDWEDLSVIRFYRFVYGMRLDLTLHSGDPADWPEGVYCDLTAGLAVYVAPFAGAEPPLVARDFSLEPAPLGWRVTNVLNPNLYAVPVCGTCATCR
ncbi:MAG TPA: DUF2723 domain-containing protein [Chloroflexia bacterium]|nr:DUF2723 domain-containing protein [Chloroflexia bacterium]